MSYVDKAVVNGQEVDLGKPIFQHNVYIFDSDNDFILSCIVTKNDDTQFTWQTFKAYVEATSYLSVQPVSCNTKISNKLYNVCRLAWADNKIYLYGMNITDSSIVSALDATALWNNLFSGDNNQFTDSIEKVN